MSIMYGHIPKLRMGFESAKTGNHLKLKISLNTYIYIFLCHINRNIHVLFFFNSPDGGGRQREESFTFTDPSFWIKNKTKGIFNLQLSLTVALLPSYHYIESKLFSLKIFSMTFQLVFTTRAKNLKLSTQILEPVSILQI